MAPAPASFIGPIDRLDSQERPDLVDADHALELRELRVRDGGEKKNRGVVHQDVERSEVLGGGLHGASPIGLRGDVEVDVARRIAQLSRHALPQIVADVGQHHLRAFFDEEPRGHLTRAPCRTRHDRHLSIQHSHLAFLLLPLA